MSQSAEQILGGSHSNTIEVYLFLGHNMVAILCWEH